MTVARRLGRPAADVARTVAAHVVDPRGWLARVEAAGPGFVNLEASLDCWRAALATRLGGAAPAAPPHGRAVVVLTASPGALRAAAVADALARLLAASGHEVERTRAATPDVAADDPRVRAEDDPRARVSASASDAVPVRRIVVVHDATARDAARRAKAAVAAAGGRPGHVTAVPVAPLEVRRRGRIVDGADAAAIVATPAALFAMLATAPATPAVLDADRLGVDRIDDAWTRLRYAAVRIARVGTAAGDALPVLDALGEAERECLRAVGMAPDVVALAARRLEPEAVAAHARALAATFHRYYNRGRFDDGGAAVPTARRALARGVGLVLQEMLALLALGGTLALPARDGTLALPAGDGTLALPAIDEMLARPARDEMLALAGTARREVE
jgi:arginyl-tRNA synthetase